MKYTKWMGLGLMVAALAVTGCGDKKTDNPKVEEKKGGSKPDEHTTHGAGPNGGVVFDLGKHHAEFTVDHAKKECTVFILSGDEKNIKRMEVVATEFTLTTKETKTKVGKVVPPMTITLKPVDAKDGKASKFVGTDSGLGNVADFSGTVIGEIEGKPSQGEFKEEEHDEKKAMGAKDDHGRAVVAVPPGKEAEVYLKPGGIYTAADIKANGDTTVSAKYKDLKVSHDLKPVAGDRLCPVTLTKANPDLKWVIGGKTYTFCCPPCVEEFVALAKTNPDEVKAPETYIKK